MKKIKKTASQIVLILIFIILIIFLVQNLTLISIYFINWELKIPLFVALILLYILGAISGGLLYGLIRNAIGNDGESVPKKPEIEVIQQDKPE